MLSQAANYDDPKSQSSEASFLHAVVKSAAVRGILKVMGAIDMFN
jgi:hypothetical protein